MSRRDELHAQGLVDCHEAADRIEQVLGPVESAGLTVRSYIQDLRSCDQERCQGNSPLAVEVQMNLARREDFILALLN